jgi:hypothetical protein
MQKSEFVMRRHLASRLAIIIACGMLAASPPLGAACAKETSQAKQDKDWPCRQILVDKIALPTVWSGPPIAAVDWRRDDAIAGFVTQLAARRTPLEAAERSIESFAKSAGTDKTIRLTALFAGLFETLNSERAQVIDGLNRFGHRQKELAEKIRSENALMQADSDRASTHDEAQATTPIAQNLEWDLRVFEERRQSLTYVCETPMLIEQRLFGLAKSIQNSLD